MASIFRRKGKDGKVSKYWFYSYRDEDGQWRTQRGLTDKRLTEQLAAKKENQADRVRTGLVDRAEKQRADARKAPLSEHIDAFEKHLGSKGNTRKHNKLTLSRIRAVIDEGEIKTLADFTVEAVVAVLQDLQREDDLGHRTYNHYVQALDGLGRWMVDTDRVLSNPLKGLPRLNSAEDVRHKRRALSASELASLVGSAETSKKSVQDYPGDLRARLYRMAYLTGLRRRELGSLTAASFNLANVPPTLTVEAACSKHRKQDTLPIHPELLPLLREWLPTLRADEYLFPKLDRKKTWGMVKVDLEAVGIEYETAEGIADFHAAGRHSHVSGLVNSGVSLAHARQLARHGDVRMTMRYTHVGLEDQAESLKSLPAPAVNLVVKTNGKTATQPAAQVTKSTNGAQHMRSTSEHSGGHSGSSVGNGIDEEVVEQPTKNPCGSRGYDAEGHSESSGGKTTKKWRRRESKDRTGFRKWLSDQSLGLFRRFNICSRVAILRHFGSRTVTGRHLAVSHHRNLAIAARTYQARDASACRHALKDVRSRARLSVHFAPVRSESFFQQPHALVRQALRKGSSRLADTLTKGRIQSKVTQ